MHSHPLVTEVTGAVVPSATGATGGSIASCSLVDRNESHNESETLRVQGPTR